MLNSNITSNRRGRLRKISKRLKTFDPLSVFSLIEIIAMCFFIVAVYAPLEDVLPINSSDNTTSADDTSKLIVEKEAYDSNLTADTTTNQEIPLNQIGPSLQDQMGEINEELEGSGTIINERLRSLIGRNVGGDTSLFLNDTSGNSVSLGVGLFIAVVGAAGGLLTPSTTSVTTISNSSMSPNILPFPTDLSSTELTKLSSPLAIDMSLPGINGVDTAPFSHFSSIRLIRGYS